MCLTNDTSNVVDSVQARVSKVALVHFFRTIKKYEFERCNILYKMHYEREV